MKMNVKILGLEEFERNLKKVSGRVTENTINQSLMEAAEPIREEAAGNAPRRTGKLSRNIIKELDKRKKSTVNIGPGKGVFYGLFLERGTSKMRPRPFLRPAFDTKKAEAQRVFKAAIRRIIEGVRF